GARARDFIRAMPGIVDLANGSKPLGSGPFATTERKALDAYADHMDQVGGIGQAAMDAALEYRDQPFRGVKAVAGVLAIVAGVQRCGDCGQVVSPQGHDCPARLAAVPDDDATVRWLGDLAASEAVRDVLSERGGWGADRRQRTLWDGDGDDEGLDDEDDEAFDDGDEEFGDGGD